jgi:hypothetical protein
MSCRSASAADSNRLTVTRPARLDAMLECIIARIAFDPMPDSFTKR